MDRSGRLVGVDVARALALVGMAATHLFPAFTPERELHPAYEIAAGRAAALFAVLAGVSLALAHGGRHARRGRRLWSDRMGVLARALALLGLGLLLGAVDSPPLVILAYYAVLFALMTPFLGLGARALAGWVVAAALLTPVVSHVLRQYVPEARIAEPGGADLPVELLLTGTYPALTWSAYALAGMAIGRGQLRTVRAALTLVVGGAALAAAAAWASALALSALGGAERLRGVPEGIDRALLLSSGLFGTTPRVDWRWLAVAAPHSGTTFDLAHTIGTSMVVLGGCLLAVRLLPRRALLPLAAAGSMTLTLYTAHVLALAEGSPVRIDDPFTAWLTHVAVALVLATIWRRRFRRGPLETVVSKIEATVRSVALGRGDPVRPEPQGRNRTARV